ncbi:hypothetical protein H257_12527 [Aphanomyces astaci]|uniref:Uncharacterized protein n=1 Tax=Aphanomyces astaci TaxID=112090 RepID=W4G0B5_APHAT|nr:hypothetical protein H257_12527 [Aphanomyces astaci]ETV72383.1 hypothetical protein H257_12527 [Aphanomyces astaci]|eukprot:XP_009838065.1 hypothetical protein H257_12527 [Aphanomyces astaci]
MGVDGGVRNASTTFMNPFTTIGHCLYSLLDPSSINACRYTKNMRARSLVSASGDDEPHILPRPHRFGGSSSSSTCSSSSVHCRQCGISSVAPIASCISRNLE